MLTWMVHIEKLGDLTRTVCQLTEQLQVLKASQEEVACGSMFAQDGSKHVGQLKDQEQVALGEQARWQGQLDAVRNEDTRAAAAEKAAQVLC
jgi:hypothetical protein